MLDIYKNHPTIRFIVTSSTENKKLKFTNFLPDDDLKRLSKK